MVHICKHAHIFNYYFIQMLYIIVFQLLKVYITVYFYIRPDIIYYLNVYLI